MVTCATSCWTDGAVRRCRCRSRCRGAAALERCLYTCAHGRVCARPMARAGAAVNRRRGRLPVPASLGGCRPVWVGRPPRAQPVGRPSAGRSRRGRRQTPEAGQQTPGARGEVACQGAIYSSAGSARLRSRPGCGAAGAGPGWSPASWGESGVEVRGQSAGRARGARAGRAGALRSRGAGGASGRRRQAAAGGSVEVEVRERRPLVPAHKDRERQAVHS